MTTNSKLKFLAKLEQMSEELYRQGDSVSHGDDWKTKRSFLWGFAEAGRTLNLVSKEDIQRAIDRAHYRIFGEDRLTRIGRHAASRNEDAPDWDAFDSPTYERMTHAGVPRKN